MNIRNLAFPEDSRRFRFGSHYTGSLKLAENGELSRHFPIASVHGPAYVLVIRQVSQRAQSGNRWLGLQHADRYALHVFVGDFV